MNHCMIGGRWSWRKAMGRAAVVAVCLAAFAMPAHAMFGHAGRGAPPGGGGGGGMGGPPGGGGMGGGAMGGHAPNNFGSTTNTTRPPNAGPNSAGTAAPRFTVSLGPAGRFWDDKKIAKKLSLRPEQQQRMDEIFDGSKGPLLNSYRVLQQEETRLDAVVHEEHPDEQRIFAQIDREAQARAEVEKALARLTLQIRRELDAGQLAKLDQAQ